MKYPRLDVAIATLILTVFSNISLADSNAKVEMPTVESVDLDSYIGLWYEIRRIENKFQDNEPSAGEGVCVNVTAEYEYLPNNKIKVKNTCYRKSSFEVALGKARAVEGSNNAKLKVNFTGIALLDWFGIGSGDYWILALGEKNSQNMYSWALVGSPSLNYGWILSRTENLADSEIEKALNIAKSVGYDVNSFKSFRR